jgi:hypothetical protein
MSPANAAPEFTRDESGLMKAGDIPITVASGGPPMFVWLNAVAYSLIIDTSLAGNERTMWEVNSTVGFSMAVRFGVVPEFAEEICGPVPLIPGLHYFVSIYGTYPRYGIREFVA